MRHRVPRAEWRAPPPGPTLTLVRARARWSCKPAGESIDPVPVWTDLWAAHRARATYFLPALTSTVLRLPKSRTLTRPRATRVSVDVQWSSTSHFVPDRAPEPAMWSDSSESSPWVSVYVPVGHVDRVRASRQRDRVTQRAVARRHARLVLDVVGRRVDVERRGRGRRREHQQRDAREDRPHGDARDQCAGIVVQSPGRVNGCLVERIDRRALDAPVRSRIQPPAR